MSTPEPTLSPSSEEPPPAGSSEDVFVFPVSSGQHGLWLVDQFEPDSAYSLPVLWRVAGELDPVLLEDALNEIIRRHEILRTTFSSRNGDLVQVILPQARLTLAFVDLSSLPAPESETRALHQASVESRRSFDLSRGPLFRAHLWRMGRRDHLLLLNMHHIVADGWSIGVLLRELTALYEAFAQSRPSPLPDLPLQYADFADWQRQRMTQNGFQEHLRFWKKALAGAPPVLELRTDRARLERQTYSGASEAVLVPSDLTARVKELSRREGATLFMTLLSAFYALLQRHTGQTDLVVGSPIANRTRVEFEPLIGLFINTLVLRADLSGDPTFRELLARVRRTCLDAYAHQDLPFERLVEELNPARTLSHTPLFQVMMTVQNVPPIPPRLAGAPVTPIPPTVETSKFDLTGYFEDRGDEIWASFEYNTGLFDSPTVRWMLAQFRTLLEGAVSDPDRRLWRLSLLPEGQRRAQAAGIHRVRATSPFVEFPPEDIEQSITERFEQQARRHSSRLAIVAGSRRWTYERLAREADRVARVVRGLAGEGPQRVALLFEQDAPMIAAMLGSLAAGKTYVPLDPSYPAERLRYMLHDAGATLLLTEDRHLSLANSVAAGGCVVASLDRLRAGPTPAAVAPVSPDTVAYILYTSGSTGRPKGVVQNHRNVLHFIRAYTNRLRIRTEDRLSLLASYSFDAAVMDIFGALLNGATLCLWNVKARGVSGLAQWLEEEAVTVFHAVPTVFREFGDTLNEGQRLSKVRLVVLGGEEVRRGDVDVYRNHFSGDCLFVNGLGPTESTVALQYFLDQRTEIRRGTVPVGYGVDDTEIVLLDAEGRATELYGEIAIRSPHVALGYWGKPEATEAAFLPDPQGGKRRIYRTGDLGRLLPDGAIEFVGRKGSRVKIRGHRIELAEIEQTLTEHPSVRKVVVVLCEETPGDQRLIAYLVGATERSANTADVRFFLEGKLPDFMIPSSFVWLDTLPLTPSGKVDRAALPPPAADGPSRPQVSVSPRSALESKLVRIWERILQVRRIGVTDNFFDLGGHSLLAVRLLTQVEKETGRSLPLSAIFQAQTVAAMAARLEQDPRAPSSWSSLLAIQPDGPRPPLFCVHAQGSNALEYRGFTSRLGDDQPIYGLVPRGLDGRLPPHDRVEDMAAHYIAEIREIQPEGPYYLGGWSFGGIIAFEMARQLRAAGQGVAFLALFDTYARPRIHRAAPGSPILTNLRFLWRRLRFHVAAFWRLEPRARAWYFGSKAGSALLRSRKKLDALLGSAYTSVRQPLPEAVERTHAANRRAAAAYVPQAYDGQVTLFRATGLGVTSFDDPYLGWGEVPGIDIEVIEVPGAHVSLLREKANVSVLADKLAKRLRHAQGPESRTTGPRRPGQERHG